MIGLALLGALVQARQPTVGDTVWVEIRATVPARMILRPQPWDAGAVGQVLGPPIVESSGQQVLVRYPVAFWYPGVHTLDVPGPVLISPEGRSDTLPPTSVVARIGTVLPADVPPGKLEPKPSEPLIDRPRESLLPLAVLEGVAVILIAAWLWLTRRRRRSQPPLAISSVNATPWFQRWTALGEPQAAVIGWLGALSQATAIGRPGAEELLAALEEARYAPVETELLERLEERAKALLEGKAS